MSLDRPAAVLHHHASPDPAAQPAPATTGRARVPARAAAVLQTDDDHPARPEGRSERSLPKGWGSFEERRLVLWGIAGFFALGLYAAAFVVIGQLIWS